MSNPAGDAGPAAGSGDSLSFEESLHKLETIVEAMEADDLPLETLLLKYEEGARLAGQCQARLADAELKIQQLEKSGSGFVLKNLAISGKVE